jgi:hypothetical protein
MRPIRLGVTPYRLAGRSLRASSQSCSARNLRIGSDLTEKIGNLRDDLDGGIVPAMAGRRKREIRDQDVQGLKFLRKIRPLLSRLRKVGTERDTAGNRRLFMDQYCALILHHSRRSPSSSGTRSEAGRTIGSTR